VWWGGHNGVQKAGPKHKGGPLTVHMPNPGPHSTKKRNGGEKGAGQIETAICPRTNNKKEEKRKYTRGQKKVAGVEHHAQTRA